MESVVFLKECLEKALTLQKNSQTRSNLGFQLHQTVLAYDDTVVLMSEGFGRFLEAVIRNVNSLS